MALDFPSNPTVGQAYNGFTFDGTAWISNPLQLNSNLQSVADGTYIGDDSITTVGTISTGVWNGTAIPVANGGTGSTSASAARTALGLAIGTNVQAYNASLAAIAGGTYAGDNSITTVGTIGTGTWNGTTIALAKGGTGATTAATARTNLGLEQIKTLYGSFTATSYDSGVGNSGLVWWGEKTVSFGQTFAQIPTISVYPLTTGAVMSVHPITVSTTGFTFRAIRFQATLGTSDFGWSATGRIS